MKALYDVGRSFFWIIALFSLVGSLLLLLGMIEQFVIWVKSSQKDLEEHYKRR